jgi:Xaa-Pro aminopeptidase
MLLNRDRLEDMLGRHGLDAAVATTPENVTYASGYWALSQWIRRGPQTYVLLPAKARAEPVIIASTTLLDLLADQDVWITQVRRFGYFQADRGDDATLDDGDRRQASLYDLPDDKDALSSLAAAICDAGLERGRIAVDELGLLPGYFERLRTLLPRVTLVDGHQLFRQIRAVKTPKEIQRLARAAHIAERSIDAALSIARPGATEEELALAFHGQTVADGGLPVLGCIGFGRRSAMPNVMPSTARLQHGEVIRFDVGGRFQHYRADIARIATLGQPDARVRRSYQALHRGVLRAYELIRPGVRCADVFEAVVETVRRDGIQHYRRSHVGHGIGIDGYDLPDISPSSRDVFEAGMVLCVETPYYELGWCGLQVEDMVVVRESGIEQLMTTDGALRVI